MRTLRKCKLKGRNGWECHGNLLRSAVASGPPPRPRRRSTRHRATWRTSCRAVATGHAASRARGPTKRLRRIDASRSSRTHHASAGNGRAPTDPSRTAAPSSRTCSLSMDIWKYFRFRKLLFYDSSYHELSKHSRIWVSNLHIIQLKD